MLCRHALLIVVTKEATIIMNFHWDPQKASLNLKKHGVLFEDAVQVFCDDRRLESYDDRGDYGEDRWATIGAVGPLLLVVVYTIRENESVRIISARRANTHEKARYRNAQN